MSMNQSQKRTDTFSRPETVTNLNLETLSRSLEEGLNHATATVLRVDPPYLWVKTEPNQGGCSGCHAQSSCGTATLSKLFTADRSQPLKVLNATDSPVLEGDQVVLELKESDLIQHAFMAYGIPLVGLFTGALAFQAIQQHWHWWQGSEGFVVLGSALGMLMGWWGVKKWYRPCLPVARNLEN
ncbi:SoxR reducing system RseC family protein [Galenea microaerophila]